MMAKIVYFHISGMAPLLRGIRGIKERGMRWQRERERGRSVTVSSRIWLQEVWREREG